MALYLIPLGTDNFTRTNVSPLASPWEIDDAGDAGLQIVSDLCELTGFGGTTCGQTYNYAPGTPDDQYASCTIDSYVVANTPYLNLFARWTDTGAFCGAYSHQEGYVFHIVPVGASSTWQLFTYLNLVASGTLTSAPGDVYALAALGTTVYLLQNGTVLTSVSNSTYSSGGTFLGSYGRNAITDIQFSAFAMGEASATEGTVDTSTFSPAAGAVPASSMITVNNADSGLSGFSSFYTTDGTVPTVLSTPYSGPITLGTLPETIKVLATATNYSNSAIASATYTKKSSKPPTHPVFGTAPSRFDSRITAGKIVGTGDITRIQSGE